MAEESLIAVARPTGQSLPLAGTIYDDLEVGISDREPIHHAQDATTLLGLGDDDLRGVGGCTEDPADLGNPRERASRSAP
jgi:hypothetical protein